MPLFSPFFPRLPIFMVTFPYMELHILCILSGFPGSAVVKNLPANAGDTGSIPGSGRSPGEGYGNPLQCSCLENPTDGGACWAAVYGVAQGRTRLPRLSSSSSSTREYIYIFLSIYACSIAQSCPNLYSPIDCSLPGSSVHGVFQARILEWVTISYCRGSS